MGGSGGARVRPPRLLTYLLRGPGINGPSPGINGPGSRHTGPGSRIYFWYIFRTVGYRWGGKVTFIPSKRFDEEVWLCWKEGETEIKFWHEKDTGFNGRKPVSVDAESLI